MARARPLWEIFEEISKETDKEKKIALLKKNYDNQAFMTLLKYTFDPNIEWLLPSGKPNFKKFPLNEPALLYQSIKKLYLFVKGGRDDISDEKRRFLFLGFLESIYEKDAALILEIKKKAYRGIPKLLVKEAFPDLWQEE